jgi:hypothetical protein
MRGSLALLLSVGLAFGCSKPAAVASDAGPADVGHITFADAGVEMDAGPEDAGPEPLPPARGTLGSRPCDPMVTKADGGPFCGLPFPSSVYLIDDPNTVTGRRVSFPMSALPAVGATHLDPAAWADSDGFSPGHAAMTYLPRAAATGLPGQNNIALSIDAAHSPTLLLEDPSPVDPTVVPTLVPHFTELDANGQPGLDQALMIHPAIRLKDNMRYIVAIRHVKDSVTGADVAPNPLFVALRDGTDNSDGTVLARRNLYLNILAKLKLAGIDTTDLQIAWDYQTASRENNTQQLVTMRDLAFAALPANGPLFTIVGSTDNPDYLTGRRIFGKVTVPLFLDSGTVSSQASNVTTGFTLQTDEHGLPKQNGTADFDFVVNVPKSVFNDTAPAPIVIQGHGFYSDRTEGQDAYASAYDYLLRLANDHKYVTVAVDLIGWRSPQAYTQFPYDYQSTFPSGDPNPEDDSVKMPYLLGAKATAFRGIIDRTTQAIINELVAVRMMETSLSNDASLKGSDGHKFVDTTKSYYRGDSLGGLLGVTFMALSQTTTRGYLGEPGIPFGLIANRCKDFNQFILGLGLSFPSAVDQQIVVQLLQMYWDRVEGNGFAPYVTANPLPNTPLHSVLIADAMNDFQVTPLAAHILARTVGAKNLKPTVRSVFGLDAVDGPVTGTAMLEFNFNTLDEPGVAVPDTNTPPVGDPTYDPHYKVRQLVSSETAADTFFRTGTAVNPCTTSGAPSACTIPPF